MIEDMSVTRNDLPALLLKLYKKFPEHLHDEHSKQNLCYVYDAVTHVLTAYRQLDKKDPAGKLVEIEGEFYRKSRVWIMRELVSRSNKLEEVFTAHVQILSDYREPLYINHEEQLLVMRNRGDSFSIYIERKPDGSLF